MFQDVDGNIFIRQVVSLKILHKNSCLTGILYVLCKEDDSAILMSAQCIGCFRSGRQIRQVLSIPCPDRRYDHLGYLIVQ